ncbi:MAG: hypothetical protein WHU10_03915 [Fimbriimonadales bacterium]
MALSADLQPLYRVEFDAAELTQEHPPVWFSARKRAVYELCCPPERPPRGTIVVSRWSETHLPERYDPTSPLGIEARRGAFDYARRLPDPAVEWHLNFAASELFCAYSGGLVAQDEMQVTEHPALGSVREALLARGLSTTVNDGRASSPILVRGVERRCSIATDPNAEEGRPEGLYGNAFDRAPLEAVLRAVRVLDPPTASNILAIEAPTGGYGTYTAEQIRGILRTAHGGFLAARAESRAADPAAAVAVHTGFWGCGAYGGNRVLMALLQLVAARLAGLDLLVFHAFDAAGLERFREAEATLERLAPEEGGPIPMDDLIDRIADLGFAWGVSDGN